MREQENAKLTLTGQCTPSFQAGEYKLETVVQLQAEEINENSQKSVKYFAIQGSRFTLRQGQVSSVYPAMGEYCSNEHILPHVVVNPCTLPFECEVKPQNKGALTVPYLALLLFREEEIPVLTQGLVSDLFKDASKDSIFYSKDYTKEEGELACTFMDVPWKLFSKIAPTAEELALLVHGRKADLQLKALTLDEMEAKELQSVIFCNRLPKCGTEEKPCRNHVCLVSFADCEKLWECEKPPSYVRLAVLYHWEFWGIKDKNEDKLLENVYARGMTLPVSERAGNRTRKIIQNGYVPMEHFFRDGSKSVSFYRGPFLPDNIEKTVENENNQYAPYRYDPELGMFDVSYAAAWELGRLMALSREDIAKKILFLKNQTFQRCHNNAVRQMTIEAGCAENMEKQLLDFFEKCFGEREDEVVVSERNTAAKT